MDGPWSSTADTKSRTVPAIGASRSVSLSTPAWLPTPSTTTGMRSRRMSAVSRTSIGS